MKTEKLPKRALTLANKEGGVDVANGGKGFHMVGYSGGIIENHWHWGNLAIDLFGMQFPKAKYPILRDHDTNRLIAYAKKPNVSDGQGLVFTEKETSFLDTADAKDFLAQSKAGFPFEASIYAVPTEIEEVDEGESTEVNGRRMEGPGVVWRISTFKECSVCVFGYDSQTSAQAFTGQDEELTLHMNVTPRNEYDAMAQAMLDRANGKQNDYMGRGRPPEALTAEERGLLQAVYRLKDMDQESAFQFLREHPGIMQRFEKLVKAPRARAYVRRFLPEHAEIWDGFDAAFARAVDEENKFMREKAMRHFQSVQTPDQTVARMLGHVQGD